MNQNTKSKISKRKKKKIGKRNRAAGQRFEAKVRQDLETQGFIVDRWLNNVDLKNNNGIGKLIPAKRKYNPYLRALSIGTGFPDFICFKKIKGNKFNIIGVEVKRNGWLDKIEKEKCKWLLNNKIFPKILIAKAKKQGHKLDVEYIDFRKKYI